MKLTKSTLRQIIKEEIQKLNERGYSIGGSGLVEVKDKILILPNSEYYLGASSSPTHIIVVSVNNNVITYRSSPYDRDQRIETWIGKDLITKGTEIWLKSGYAKYSKDTSKTLRANLQGKKGPRNGKHSIAKYRKFLVTAWGDTGQDVYSIGKAQGVVGDWDDVENSIEVEVDSFGFDVLKKDIRIRRVKKL